MGTVYLIGEKEGGNVFKIGSTHGDSADVRLRQLQTGNSSELSVRHSFSTDTPFKLEKMLHVKYGVANLIGEWFSLSDDDVSRFPQTCQRLQSTIDSLRENPFFKRT